MMPALLSLQLSSEDDLVLARHRTRTVAELIGFDRQDQTRLATAVSEIARNAIQYGGGGRISYAIEGKTPPQLLTVTISDNGPGIANIDDILSGRYRSTTGMGLGLIGARRLVDQMRVEPRLPTGVQVSLHKIFPRNAPLVRSKDAPALAQAIVDRAPQSPVEELRQQNQELLRALASLRERQDDLERLNGELEDTNRGVIALLAELDEKAEHLRRADEMKTRFLSNMSHEFRTPLNAIRGLSNLLIDRTDGDLTAEQEKQVRLIWRAAHELTELVDDLLDLAKVEAGKTEVRPSEFDVRNLVGALRGMLRPVWLNSSVALNFEEPEGYPPIYADERKVSQILRNFISNALKFTERGEVRVSTTLSDDGQRVVFSVADTGIGIREEDQALIFQEFTQVEHHLQKRSKGTGLGLPLSRRLAELLGGRVWVESRLGAGATFYLEIPVRFQTADVVDAELPQLPVEQGIPVLVVEDSPESVLLYEKYLQGSSFRILHASTLQRTRYLLAHRQVSAIILDIMLKGEDSWALLAELKAAPATRSIPIIVLTHLDDSRKAVALNADAFGQKPPSRRWLLDTLVRLTQGEPRVALIVDDEETARYLMARTLTEMGWRTVEAATGRDGLLMARRELPAVVLLDLGLPDMSGWEVLGELRREATTRAVPVILATGQEVPPGTPLLTEALGVLPKNAPQVDRRARLAELLQKIPGSEGSTHASSNEIPNGEVA